MSSKVAAEKQRHGQRRYRALARSLHARVFVNSEGRMLLVGGKPEMRTLMSCLGHRNELPRAGHGPTPTELGLPILCDGEMTLHPITQLGLQARSHALMRWETALANERHKQRPNRRRTRQLAAEHQEIGRLRGRLAELFAYYRQLRDGEAAAEPYWLCSTDEHTLRGLLAQTEGNKRLSPLARWFARVVFWLSGETAAARYVACLGPVLRSTSELELAAHLRKFQQQLLQWKKRSKAPGAQVLHAEVREAVKRMPKSVVETAQLTWRCKGRTLVEHCDWLQKKCDEVLKRCAEFQIRRAPAAMAALAACDGGRAPLPARLVEECVKKADHAALERCVLSLCGLATLPEYDQLLTTVQQLETLPEYHAFNQIRHVLAAGGSLDDVVWATKRSLLSWFDGPACDPGWLRAFVQAHDDVGIKLNESQLWRVLPDGDSAQNLSTLQQWRKWLGMYQKSTFTPRIRQVVLKSLVELIGPTLLQTGAHGAVRSWADPPRRQRHFAAPGNPELRSWLCRIAFYQKLLGRELAIPKSLRKFLDISQRHEVETQYLQQLAATGRALPSQQARLAYLQKSLGPQQASAVKMLRAAEEVCLMTAMAALRHLVSKRLQAQWQQRTGAGLPAISLSHQFSLVEWVNRLEPAQREVLNDVLAACARFGPGYKGMLKCNAEWLAAAEARGINTQPWLDPDPTLVEIDGDTVRVGVTRDPIDLLLMGTHFATCLSLGDCNEMSVLANAYDANKQVIFVRDANGQLLARQIIAVSKDFALLRYQCYLSRSTPAEEPTNQYEQAMAEYCGRLARRCGLALANEGEPASIANHFWYDDGVWDWDAAAREAWEAEEYAGGRRVDCAPRVALV